MITKAHITRRASAEGVPARTVERDYVLAHVVAAIAAHDAQSMLIFKGGTSLRFCHFERYRYSADLDYSVVTGSCDEAREVVRGALDGVVEASVSVLRLSDDRPPRLAYVGPLGRERMVKLDLADDEHVVHTERRPMLARWPDLRSAKKVLVYTPLEVAAEKLRCVLQRLQCRDLFDLGFLLDQAKVDPLEAKKLFVAKARHRGFDPDSFSEKYRTRLVQYRHRWETELVEHVPGRVPHFDEVERGLGRFLRRAGLI